MGNGSIEIHAVDPWDVALLFEAGETGGKIVKTKGGLIGKTKNSDSVINEKVPVYCEGGQKLLCDPRTLKIIGYYD